MRLSFSYRWRAYRSKAPLSPIGALVAVALLVAVLSSCAPRSRVVELPPSAGAVSEKTLVDTLRSRIDHWKSYQANLRVRAEGSKGRYSFRTLVVADLPGRFRLEAYSPWGQAVGVLLFDSGTSSLWIPSEKVVYTAERAEALVEHFLGVPVSVEVLAYSVIAAIPPEFLDGLDLEQACSGWVARAPFFPGERSAARTGLGGGAAAGSQGLLAWHFTSSPLFLDAVNVERGKWKYEIRYDPAVGLDFAKAPERIEFRSSEWRMEIGVEEIRQAPEPPESSFTLPVPAGARVIDLGRLR